MKKRLLLIFTSLFSIITLAIGIVSFSYAWLAQEPEYHFTLTTGDYPLLVKSNLYTTSFEYTNRQVSPDRTTSTNLDYQDPKLRLNKERFKSFNYDENKIQTDNDKNTKTSETSGTLTLSFVLTKNILDATSKLSIIGNSSNGYALDNRYFYVAFIEFLFVKEFFDAYLICKATSEICETTSETCKATSETESNLFKYTFLESVQTAPDPNNSADYNKVNFININSKNNDVTLNNGDVNVLLTATPEKTLKDIYDTGDTGIKESKKISPLATKVDNEICYSYAAVYGIYVDPTILLSKNSTTLEGTLSLSFEFTLSDSSVLYDNNTPIGS